MPGQSKVPRHSERPFLCVGGGKSPTAPSLQSLLSYIIYSFSILPAISLEDGILHCDIVEGSFTTATFKRFVERLLDNMQPFPNPNSVIVMDNCQIHKHPEIQDVIKARYVESFQMYVIIYVCVTNVNHYRGMRCEFLPPYSPDYNPIELAFSAMKYHLRANGEYARMAMTQMADEDIYITLMKALLSISPTDIQGWYGLCGYV